VFGCPHRSARHFFRPRTRFFSNGLSLLTFLFLAPQLVFGTDRHWTGATNTTWGTSTNWDTAPPGGTTDNAVFNSTFTNQPNLGATATAGGLWMTGSVGQNTTITGNTLTLQGNTINGTAGLGILMDNANAFTLTINAPLKLGAAQTWRNNTSNLLTIGTGGLNTNTKALTFDGSGNTTISGIVSGGGSLTENGSGTLTLSGVNTYSGATTISAGVLNIQNAAALGTNATGTTVGSGAALQVQGGIAVGTEALTLNGGGIASDGALRNISGTNSMGGAITLGSSTTIGSAAGTLTLSGTINNGGFLATVTGAGNVTTSGVISGTGGLTKTGSGTLTLSGAAANTYQGGTTVNDGTLLLNMNAGKNASNGTLTVGDGTGVANSAVTRWMADNQVPNKTVTINSDGLLDLNNHSDTIGALSMTGGNVSTGTGTLTLGGDVTGNASAGTATISGNLALGGNRIFNIADGAATTDMLVSAVVSGAFNVTKNGAGTLVFSGANTYTGTTTVNGGTFSTGTSTITPTAPLSIASGATYTSTGTINFTPSTSSAQTLVSGAGTLQLGTSSSSAAAPDIYYDPTGGTGAGYQVTIASNIDVGTGNRFINGKSDRNDYERYGGDLVFGGNLTGSANLTFTGTPNAGGTNPSYQVAYTLQGNNSGFSGGITITDGANLIVDNSNALTAANSLTFTPGAGAIAGFYLYGTNVTIGALSGTSAGTMNIRNGSLVTDNNATINPNIVRSNAVLTVQQNTNTTFNGIIGDGPNDHGAGDSGTYYTLGLVKTGTGSLTLGGTNTYTGGTTINGGTLVVNSASSLGATGGGLTINAGTLEVSSGFSTSRVITLGNAASTFQIDPSQTYTITSAIGGSGQLNKSGAGTMVLSGANTYTGGTSIAGGTLSLGSSGALGSSGTIRFAGGTIQNSSSNTTDYSARFSSGASQAYSIDTNGQNLMFASALTSSGGTLTKIGNGILTLGNNDTTANTYTSLTTISGGELDLKKQAGTNAIAGDGNTGTSDVSVAGGTLKWLANSQIADNATIAVSSGTVSLNGFTETLYAFTNSGGVFTTGTGHLIGTGATVTWSGGTNTVNDGGLVEDGHIVISGGTNTVQGGTTGGVLQLDSGGTGLEMTGSTLTLNSDNNVAGKLVLQGDVTSKASGTTSQIVSGLSNMNAGTINLNGGTRTFTVEDGAAATDFAVAAVITNGSLTKAGAGTMALSGANTLSGAVTVSAGLLTLAASSGSALGSATSITVNSGGTLCLGANDQINNSATMSLGGGTFAKSNFSEGTTSSAGVGALTLTAIGSHVDFGTGTVGILTFASLNAATFTLNIDNWTGNYNTAGSPSTDRLIFNSDQASNLNNFFFTGYGAGGVEFNLGGGYWEVVAAVPEPSTLIVAMLASAAVVFFPRCVWTRRSASEKRLLPPAGH
jgi:autotransporter-associated beta strand protein